jgi:DNA-binding transcriptional LysR family regulator
MDLRRVDLNLLRLVDAILHEGSASRAALRLRLSQPAVSQGLRRAREVFADPLLVRHGNRPLPTPRGTALRPEIRAILDRIEAVLSPAAFDPASARRDFVLAASDLGQMLVLPALIARVAREAPSCRVRVVPPPGRLDMVEDIDLVLMGAPVQAGPFRWHEVFADHFVLLARRDHPALTGPMSAARFAGLRQAIVSPRGEGFQGPVDAALARLGLRREVSVMVTNFMALPAILVESDLVAAVPLRFAELGPVQMLCHHRDLPVDRQDYTMRAIWHAARHEDPGLAWLRDRLTGPATP